MNLLVLIAVSGKEGDLLDLAVQSVEREGGDVALLEGAAPHGRKLNAVRRLTLDSFDYIVCMDSDVVVWPGWREWINWVLCDPGVAACGAPRMEPEPGLHPSMLALRVRTFRDAPSFAPKPGADTGVVVSQWLATQGRLIRAPMTRHAEGWWDAGGLWWHLGSGSQYPKPSGDGELAQWAASDNVWFRKAAAFAARRAQFIAAAKERVG